MTSWGTSDYLPVDVERFNVSATAANDRKTFRFDITRFVRGWHTGQWENNGMMLRGHYIGATSGMSTNRLAFFTQYNADGAIYDPFIVVRYIKAAEAASGGRKTHGQLGPKKLF